MTQAEWESDANTMREFLLTPYWAVLQRHLEYLMARKADRALSAGLKDYGEIMQAKGEFAGVREAENMPEAVIAVAERMGKKANAR